MIRSHPCTNLYVVCCTCKLTASELSSDLCSRVLAPEMWARAAANASTAPLSSMSFSAEARKYPTASTGTESRNLDETREHNRMIRH